MRPQWEGRGGQPLPRGGCPHLLREDEHRPQHVPRDLLPSPLAEQGRANSWTVYTDRAAVSAGSGGRTLGSSRRSSGTLYRKCPSHALSATTPTSPKSRRTHSRPTATPTTLWIAQPLRSWTSHPGPQWGIRDLPHCAGKRPLVHDAISSKSNDHSPSPPHPVPALLFSQVLLHLPDAYPTQAQGQSLGHSSSSP